MSGFENIIILVIFIAFMWFFMIRPQQLQQKKRREMLASLKAGDRIVTVGGIHGSISRIHDDLVHLRIAENVTIKVSRTGIGMRLEETEAAES